MKHVQTWQAWFVLSALAVIEACGDAASPSQLGVPPDAGDASPAPDVAAIIVMPRDATPPDAGADGSDVCAPAASPTPTRCSNNTPQPDCMPGSGATQCSSATALKTCQPNGTWGAEATCPTRCEAGKCLKTVGISIGVSNTCTVLSDGSVDCWGDNYLGQLGDGTFTGPSTCSSNLPCATKPVPVLGLAGVTQVAIGSKFACAVASDGTVKCWGRGVDGILGNGASGAPDICSGVPCAMTPVTVSGLTRVKEIAAGNSHVCALLTDGSVWCWGANDYGQLGQASGSAPNTCAFEKVSVNCAISPVLVWGLQGVTAIAAGAQHTCALLGDGTVSCWGESSFGELGNGSCLGAGPCMGMGCPTLPPKVVGLRGVTAITAFGYASCALLADQTVQCWGYGVGNSAPVDAGACGMGISDTPVPISGLVGATAIAPFCVLLSSGSVECWGENAWGQLGNGTLTASPNPVPVSGLSSSAQLLAAGGGTVCAVVSSGGVQCWGSNLDGMIGNGMASGPNLCINGVPCATTPVGVAW